MPDQHGRSRSNLRRVTRTLELRNRLRQASMAVEQRESPTVSASHRSGTHKHYFWAIGGALVGGISVLIGVALLDGSRTTSLGESAKMTSPMIIAADRALAQADRLVKILQAVVNQQGSKADFEESGGKEEYKDCLENCAKSVRVDDESDKWLLIDCRNECISRYSKSVKRIRKLHTDSD